MAHRNILVLPGGCTRGLIQIACINEIEKATGKRANEIFHLIVASSVGTVNGAALANGGAAQAIEDMMLEDIPSMFKPRNRWLPWNWLKPTFDRSKVLNALSTLVPSTLKFSDLPIPVVFTAWDMSNMKPFFAKTHAAYADKVTVLDVVSWCFAAPIYYGTLSPEIIGSTLSDADVGDKNNPVDQSYQEALRRKWVGEGIEDTISITVISTGMCTGNYPFSISRMWGFLKQIVYAIRQGSSDGVSKYEIDCMAQIAASYPSTIKFQWANVMLPKSKFAFGDTTHLEEYAELGSAMFKQLDLRHFKL